MENTTDRETIASLNALLCSAKWESSPFLDSVTTEATRRRAIADAIATAGSIAIAVLVSL